MSDIQAVIFDFGNVLYHTPDPSQMYRWQKFLRLKNNEMIDTLLASPEESEYMYKVMIGEIKEQEVWESLAKRWKISPVVMRWFRQTVVTKKRLDQELLNFARSLHPRYRTAILSNAGTDLRSNFIDKFHMAEYMDPVIISAEVGMIKPDAGIYHLTLEKLGIAPQAAVFVDDLKVNVEAARQVGMHAVHHLGSADTIREVKKILGI
jgi:epoxide hydrolase-like predicted phosphatase